MNGDNRCPVCKQGFVYVMFSPREKKFIELCTDCGYTHKRGDLRLRNINVEQCRRQRMFNTFLKKWWLK